MGTFTIICNECKKERELNIGSVGDKGEISIEKIGSFDEGDVEKFHITCMCKNWVVFDRF